MAESKTKLQAPDFARTLRNLLKEAKISQIQLANDIDVTPSVISRLCSKGIGSERTLLKIFEHLEIDTVKASRLLMDWKIETSSGYRKEVYERTLRPSPTEKEYLAELFGGHAWMAYACASVGIPIREILEVAQNNGINSFEELANAKPFKLMSFIREMNKSYPFENIREIFERKSSEAYEPVLLFDFLKLKDAADYLELHNCSGTVYFGVPHFVATRYDFKHNGRIGFHDHTHGVEFVLSVKGKFKLTYKDTVFPLLLEPMKHVYVYDGREKHQLELVDGKTGILMIGRFCPKKRNLSPEGR
ncbi:hypothetical protein STSP2_01871 [Anaerohalosphaera lusitana]|uniref:HTH cro/C1-type domain-containing protein n=1 Tax=Anaerohalosphaera lusitana TaxID=1936003 RepID=A0A1U9NLB2_9BACT|nr:helix-turn-helix transcriptional regulator [Anaerohalosphaera lusitana]AQT68699.1 hypothetical protein STSP2_01871 [Anaerohalosphaera lusitana]